MLFDSCNVLIHSNMAIKIDFYAFCQISIQFMSFVGYNVLFMLDGLFNAVEPI